MRAEMEAQLRAELAQKQGPAGISATQLAQVKEQAMQQARAEVRAVCVCVCGGGGASHAAGRSVFLLLRAICTIHVAVSAYEGGHVP
jgi:hypothetical protein